jgi:hypothetical protein
MGQFNYTENYYLYYSLNKTFMNKRVEDAKNFNKAHLFKNDEEFNQIIKKHFRKADPELYNFRYESKYIDGRKHPFKRVKFRLLQVYIKDGHYDHKLIFFVVPQKDKRLIARLNKNKDYNYD